MKFQFLLDEFVQYARQCFGETLTGVYLHGSLALLTRYASNQEMRAPANDLARFAEAILRLIREDA